MTPPFHEETAERTRILIVASYASVRAGLGSLLAASEGFDLVGSVPGSGELRLLLPDVVPDVILYDYGRADAEAVLDLAAGSDAGLVMLGEDRATIDSLVGRPLRGWAFLLKEADGPEIDAAARAAAAGLVVIDASLAPLLARPAGAAPPGEAAPLTAREREVLGLIALGLPNKAIAARLGISLHTAKFHVASILGKLGAASRAEAVTIGARRGYLLL